VADEDEAAEGGPAAHAAQHAAAPVVVLEPGGKAAEDADDL
jgi:hypothetical protein